MELTNRHKPRRLNQQRKFAQGSSKPTTADKLKGLFKTKAKVPKAREAEDVSVSGLPTILSLKSPYRFGRYAEDFEKRKADTAVGTSEVKAQDIEVAPGAIGDLYFSSERISEFENLQENLKVSIEKMVAISEANAILGAVPKPPPRKHAVHL